VCHQHHCPLYQEWSAARVNAWVLRCHFSQTNYQQADESFLGYKASTGALRILGRGLAMPLAAFIVSVVMVVLVLLARFFNCSTLLQSRIVALEL